MVIPLQPTDLHPSPQVFIQIEPASMGIFPPAGIAIAVHPEIIPKVRSHLQPGVTDHYAVLLKISKFIRLCLHHSGLHRPGSAV